MTSFRLQTARNIGHVTTRSQNLVAFGSCTEPGLVAGGYQRKPAAVPLLMLAAVGAPSLSRCPFCR